MKSYRIVEVAPETEAALAAALPRLSELPRPLRAQVVKAWGSALASSDFTRFEDMVFAPSTGYGLLRHTREVCETGLALRASAEALWLAQIDRDALIATLLLHDLDKALLYRPGPDGNVDATIVSQRLPHGVLASLMLAEIGLDEAIIAAVATHAVDAPFRGHGPLEHILHYADMFCADQALVLSGKMPFFTKRAPGDLPAGT